MRSRHGAAVEGGGAVAEVPTARPGRRPAGRIVVADNDPEALDLLLLDLRLEGHAVAGASGGEAARVLADSFAADVVVLDHRMPPGPTGLDTALRLRAERPGLKIVIYSNYQDADLVATARDHGITFLSKGNLRALRTVIRALIADP